jgi:dTMP kinase
MLVVIEGCDAVGKQTQSKLLTEALHPAKLCSFPRYDTPLGALIKEHLMGHRALREVRHVLHKGGKTVETQTRAVRPVETASLFQCLATIDKYDAANDIRTDLAAGMHVVCDRYTQSALAYGLADGLDEAWLRRIQSSLPEPDLNLFIDVSEEEALRRRPQLRDRYEQDRAKQRKVRTIYASLWSTGGPGRWEVIDGHGSVEEVHGAIMRAVARTQVVGRGKR